MVYWWLSLIGTNIGPWYRNLKNVKKVKGRKEYKEEIIFQEEEGIMSFGKEFFKRDSKEPLSSLNNNVIRSENGCLM